MEHIIDLDLFKRELPQISDLDLIYMILALKQIPNIEDWEFLPDPDAYMEMLTLAEGEAICRFAGLILPAPGAERDAEAPHDGAGRGGAGAAPLLDSNNT